MAQFFDLISRSCARQTIYLSRPSECRRFQTKSTPIGSGFNLNLNRCQRGVHIPATRPIGHLSTAHLSKAILSNSRNRNACRCKAESTEAGSQGGEGEDEGNSSSESATPPTPTSEAIGYAVLSYLALAKGARAAGAQLIRALTYLYCKGVNIPDIKLALALKTMSSGSEVSLLDQSTQAQMLGQMSMIMLTLQEMNVKSDGGEGWSVAGEGAEEDMEVSGLLGWVKSIMLMVDQGYDSRRLEMEQTALTEEELANARNSQHIAYMQKNTLLVLRTMESCGVKVEHFDMDTIADKISQARDVPAVDAQQEEPQSMDQEQLEEKEETPLKIRSLHMAFMSAMYGSEYAFTEVVRLAVEVFQTPSINSSSSSSTMMLNPSNVSEYFTLEDFVVEGELVPIGVSGDDEDTGTTLPPRKFCADLFERWLWMIYSTVREMGAIPNVAEASPEEIASGGLEFVKQTLKLKDAKSLDEGEDDQASQFEDGWVMDDYLPGTSTAIAVMRQQAILVSFTQKLLDSVQVDA